ncbi:hypothetical protein LTS18_009295 [Coniosporium uncinatum]|uniref:Uncharacterized protein n=1 Tax=Coniosporium uncinatum TaxID=93489 RepID=A0ACC3DZF7_9PEZI|nr:hypothetical protein LTS18_009295 [Coniosporium uncinatum]
MADFSAAGVPAGQAPEQDPSLPGPFELRIYTMKDAEAAKLYAERWVPHIDSLGVLNIKVHGVWYSQNNPKQVIALVRHPDGANPAETGKKYMQSEGFINDMKGFDFSLIDKVETHLMNAAEASPVK